MRFFAAFLFAACVCVGAGNPARAETYRLNYEAQVLGVVVLGTARYEIAASPTRYGVRANLRTSGLARLFDQTEITAASAGTIASGGINWTRYDISHAYGSKFRRIQVTRGAQGVSAQINPRYGNMGAPPATAQQQRGSYDPLTGIFALGPPDRRCPRLSWLGLGVRRSPTLSARRICARANQFQQRRL
jgi:hypothetical protein